MKLIKLFKKHIVNKALDSSNEDKFLKITLAKYILDTELKFNLSKEEIVERLKIPPEKLLNSNWKKEAAEIQKEYLNYCEQSDEVIISNGDEIIIQQKKSK